MRIAYLYKTWSAIIDMTMMDDDEDLVSGMMLIWMR